MIKVAWVVFTRDSDFRDLTGKIFMYCLDGRFIWEMATN